MAQNTITMKIDNAEPENHKIFRREKRFSCLGGNMNETLHNIIKSSDYVNYSLIYGKYSFEKFKT